MIANLCLSNKTVTYSRVLYDEQRRHSICRDADILPLCKAINIIMWTRHKLLL